MRTMMLIPILMAGVLLGAWRPAAADAAAEKPDFTGHWVLNEKMSDAPRPGGMGGGEGGMRGGPGGMGGGMREGGMGGPPGGGESRGPRMGLPGDMVVELAEHELTVSVRGLAVRRLRFDPALAGTPPTDSIPTLPATWDGVRIVSKLESRRGEVQERWELSKDGSQLIVRTSLPAMGQRPAMEFKRVYDRVEAP